jgi:hypothetical protein
MIIFFFFNVHHAKKNVIEMVLTYVESEFDRDNDFVCVSSTK